MFENRKRNQKIKDFRRDGLKVTNYDPVKRTIALESRGGRKAELAFKLVDFDGDRQLAFSGDLITSDGEALSRVMKEMWNEPLPEEFSADEALRKQLFGEQPATEPAEDEAMPAAEPKPENEAEREEQPSAEDATKAIEAKEPQKPETIYFRDMAKYVTGQPNEVTITVKASYRIDA